MDLTKLSDADLLALKAGDYSKMSNEGLMALKASSAPEQTDSTAMDVAKSAGVGAAKGAIGLAGMVGDAAHTLGDLRDRYISNPISHALGLKEVNLDAPDPAQAIGSDNIQKQVEKVTGAFRAPQTTAGKYAESVGAMLPAVVGGPETLASRLMTRVVVPGLASEAAGQATEGTAAEPWARVGAGMLGGAAAARVAAARSAQPLQAMQGIDAVKADTNRLYNDPALQALRVHGGAVSQTGDNIAQALQSKGWFADDHAGVYNDIKRLQNVDPSVSFQELEAIRKSLGNKAGEIKDFRPTESAKAAATAKRMLDDFVNVDMTNPNNVLTGNPVAARQAIQTARASGGAVARSETISRMLDNAQIDAAGNNSGRNIENKIRQTLKPLLKNGEARIAGYTDDEKNMLRSQVRGSYVTDGLRTLGNAISRTGHIGLGVSLFNPATLIPAMAAEGGGYALKGIANRLAVNRTKALADKLLERAPINQPIVSSNNAITAANKAASHKLVLSNILRTLAMSSTLGK